MRRPTIKVFILDKFYLIQDSPDLLSCDGDIDHDDHAIWLNPSVRDEDRARVIAQAVSRAWMDLLPSLELAHAN